ncbi:hypothetical protein QNH98_15755 [Myroides sp. mNGS23_01]|nr:hypothetical protein [Myroides sp. mNGS23_01]WHT38457.1 hypothetical protein QNH98_15755 [Myroides sp. mNGS23_01]
MIVLRGGNTTAKVYHPSDNSLSGVFDVIGDFLIGEGENATYDKETVERINDIHKMDAETKNILFNVIDTYIQNFKTKKACTK